MKKKEYKPSWKKEAPKPLWKRSLEKKKVKKKLIYKKELGYKMKDTPLDDMLPKNAIVMEFKENCIVKVMTKIEAFVQNEVLYTEPSYWTLNFEAGDQIVAQIVDVNRDTVSIFIIETSLLGPNQRMLGLASDISRQILQPERIPPIEEIDG